MTLFRLGGVFLVLALCATPARAASLIPGSAPADVLLLDCPFPPGLAVDPHNPNKGFVACWQNDPGVSGFRFDPALSLSFAGGPFWFIPGNLNCSGSPIAIPQIGNLYLEPGPGVLERGWVATTGCELAVPFNAVTGADVNLLYNGQARRSIPTRHTFNGAFTRYTASGPGASISSFSTNFTSAIVRTGDRLIVSTSNFQAPGANPVLNPGTLLLFDIDDSGATPSITPANPAFIITSDPNPVALAVLPTGEVLVVNAGIFDASFPPLTTGQGSIDLIDPLTPTVLGSVPLGDANPFGRNIAIDPTASVAVAGSATERALYAIDIRGVAALPRPPIDVTVQRPSCNDDPSALTVGGVPCMRSRAIRDGGTPIVLPPATGASIYSLVSEVRFGASGDFVAATSFNDGGISLVAFDPDQLAVGLPLLPSRFGPAETLVATPPPGTFSDECCPGPMVLHANSSGGLDGTDIAWATALPRATVVRGELDGTLVQPSGDFDADTIQDSVDNCPVTANGGQSDVGSLGPGGSADGIGDACQCGDVNDDGEVLSTDVDVFRIALATGSGVTAPEKCDVRGVAGACDLVDLVVTRRTLGNLAPGIANVCAAFLP